jgi:putative copper resistance protein D
MHADALAPLTTSGALSTWRIAWVTDILVLLAGAGYLARAWRRRWPAHRTAAFLGGLAMLVIAMNSTIDIYGRVLFSVHMVQHLLLIMVIPALIVLGRPLGLLADGDDRLATLTGRILDSKPASVLTFPPLGLACYTIALVGTHVTGFVVLMFTRTWAHDVEVVSYLLGGYLFLLPVLGAEPLRRELSYLTRMFTLFIGMAGDTGVGVALMMQPRNPYLGFSMLDRDWGPAPLADIHGGGAIMWVFGDLLMMLIMVVIIGLWLRDTPHQNATGSWLEAARRGTLADETGVPSLAGVADLDSDEEALAAYNRMLAKLSEREGRE